MSDPGVVRANGPERMGPRRPTRGNPVENAPRRNFRRGSKETLMNGFKLDMTPDEFRQWGHRFVDWVAEYLSSVERVPVLSQVAPGEIRRQLPASPPQNPEP